jgi:integrase
VASIRTRQRANGSTYYALLWREDGKQRSLSFNEKAEADRWKRLLDANDQSMSQAGKVYENSLREGPTVKELINEHIELLTGVGLYQIKRYKTAVRTHFSDEFGNRKVIDVEQADVLRWIKYMQAKKGRKGGPLSAKTIANQHGLLSAAMAHAVRSRIIDRNPCKGVKLPKTVATEDTARFIKHAEWRKIMENMDKHYRPFFTFQVGSGCRFGESTALLASDFDLDPIQTDPTQPIAPSVRITKAWKQDDEGGWYIGPPKTRRSTRTVSLSPSVVEAVRGLVEAAGDGYVFLMHTGHIMRSSPAYHTAWAPALKSAGFVKDDYPRIHDVRHTHASWMLGTGMMDMTTLSRRLGHESTATTDKIYLHLMPDANWRSAQVAQKALEG